MMRVSVLSFTVVTSLGSTVELPIYREGRGEDRRISPYPLITTLVLLASHEMVQMTVV